MKLRELVKQHLSDIAWPEGYTQMAQDMDGSLYVYHSHNLKYDSHECMWCATPAVAGQPAKRICILVKQADDFKYAIISKQEFMDMLHEKEPEPQTVQDKIARLIELNTERDKLLTEITQGKEIREKFTDVQIGDVAMHRPTGLVSVVLGHQHPLYTGDRNVLVSNDMCGLFWVKFDDYIVTAK